MPNSIALFWLWWSKDLLWVSALSEIFKRYQDSSQVTDVQSLYSKTIPIYPGQLPEKSSYVILWRLPVLGTWWCISFSISCINSLPVYSKSLLIQVTSGPFFLICSLGNVQSFTPFACSWPINSYSLWLYVELITKSLFYCNISMSTVLNKGFLTI